MRKQLLVVIAVGIVVGVAGGAPDALRGSVLFVLGRAGTCSAASSVLSYRTQRYDEFLTAHVASRSEVVERRDGLERWRTPRGEFWTGPDSALMSLYAEQARGLYGRNQRGVRPGDWVLDWGANVGVFVREALDRGAAKVIAVEGSPDSVRALRLTFATEITEGRVIIYPQSDWDNRPTEGSLRQPDAGPMASIDRLVDDLALQRLDFIKMDMAVAGRQAFDGARRTLQRLQPRLAIALRNLQDDQSAMLTILKEVGPSYVEEVVDCVPIGAFEIRPEVGFYRPAGQ